MGAMAQWPSDQSPIDNHSGHANRLPSFIDFLSGAGSLDLDLMTTLSASNLDITRSQLSPKNHSVPSTYYKRAEVTDVPFELAISQHLGQVARCHSLQQPPIQPPFWQHNNPVPLQKLTALPPHLSPPFNAEHDHNRAVVTEGIVPGRSLYHVYDHGSTYQKITNRDTVNPIWGITKAGKPRKRLGQACKTCREKKVCMLPLERHKDYTLTEM